MPQDEMSSTKTASHRLRLVFSQIPGAVWATDRDLRVTYAIGRLENGPIDESRVIGKPIHEFLSCNKSHNPVVAHHRAALAGESRSFRYEFRGRCYEVHVEPLYEARQEIAGCVGVGIDVSDRRATEERLAASERRLAEAQRVAHVGSWEWNMETNSVTLSDEMYQIMGIEPGQFAGTFEAAIARVHPEDRPLVEKLALEAFRTRTLLTRDHRVVRPDGEVRMLHSRGDVVQTRGSRRLVGSSWDITDKWQTEQRLESSISLLRATLESTADGLLVIDKEGRVAAFNQRLLELWNLTAGQVEGQEFEILLAQADVQLENGDECLRRVRELASQPEAESVDVLYFRDGKVFERYSRPQRIGHEVVGRVWSYRDVTEREGLLRRTGFLSDASRLLASLDVEAALEGVARLSLQGIADACAVDLFGETGGPRRILSLSRDSARPLAMELPRPVLAGQAQMVTEGPVSYIIAPVMAHAELLGALTFAIYEPRRFREADHSLVLELARRAALSIENARLYRQAAEALQAREDFLAIAAHEIRGPVTSLHLAVQCLASGKMTDTARGRMLEVIEREDRRLSRFVDELLDIARARVGGMHFDLKPVDLSEVTREAVGRLAADVTRSHSALTLDTTGQAIGMWDRVRLEQVVDNLLTNAIKFGLGNPISVSVAVTDEKASLVVRDQGIGIPVDRQKQIFEPFGRAVSARHYGGLGLGLYIARWIVEGLGGTIMVESEPMAGSTFTVELPRGGTAS